MKENMNQVWNKFFLKWGKKKIFLINLPYFKKFVDIQSILQFNYRRRM